ncbi:hypothetical protein B0H14DRAFT_2637416 [Mycena olivaceomarginata]|nr:hypothetical protein B0H14DRAFT_2637416 [Mycena olivaceomarginata]
MVLVAFERHKAGLSSHTPHRGIPTTTPWNGDLREGQDVVSDVNEDEDVDDLPAEEGEAHSKYFNELCTVIKEAWEAESDEFRVEVMAALGNEHKATLKAHTTAVTREIPTTPEGFQMPTQNRGGVIKTHSVHAGASNGWVPQIWPDYNWAGFEAMWCSFCEPSEQCFTMEECQAQSLNVARIFPRESKGVGMRRAATQYQGEDEQDQDMEGEEVSDEQHQGDDKQDQDMGDEKVEDDLGNEAAEDAMIESLGNGCDIAEVMGPELALEVRLMEQDKRLCFKHQVWFLIDDWELEQENNMV